jgi:protocatechuate 3,4-dioxygenase beta subunit
LVLAAALACQAPAAAQPQDKFTGIVSDSSGAPVPDVRLTLYPNYFGNSDVRTDANGRYSMSLQNMQIIRQQNRTPTLVARSLERNLAAIHDIDEQTTNLDLRLEEGVTLSAKVEDAAGAPIPSARATLIFMIGMDGFPMNGETAGADEAGRIRVPALPPGQQYIVNITAPGYGSANQTLSPGDTTAGDLDGPIIVLRRMDRKLGGKVLGADGKPLGGAPVNIYGQGQPNTSTRTDSNGHFLFQQVCEGPVIVFAHGPVYGDSPFLQGNAQAQGGDMDVVVKIGVNRPLGYTRFPPLKPPSWTWTAIRQWPGQHHKATLFLLAAQLAVLGGTAGGIFWLTRKRGA